MKKSIQIICGLFGLIIFIGIVLLFVNNKLYQNYIDLIIPTTPLDIVIFVLIIYGIFYIVEKKK